MASRICLVSVLVMAVATASASPVSDVAAAVARASTPFRPGRPAPSAGIPVNLDAMRVQAAAADAARGGNDTDCRAYLLEYEFSLRLMPERAPLLDVFDALQLNANCGITPPSGDPSTVYLLPIPADEVAGCGVGPFYVDAVNGSDTNAGTEAKPFRTVQRGVDATRSARPAGEGSACVVLRGGAHFLSASVLLSPADSGLIVTGYEGEEAWVSGGVPLGPLTWTAVDTSNGNNVWVADIDAATPITAMPGLNTLAPGAVPQRLWRAKYPNFDQEQWSPSGVLPDMRQVIKWIKPDLFDIPTLYYKDLQALGLKNDSTMTDYNVYAAGSGANTPCAHWANEGDEWAYVCSNATAGGWEEIERGLASTGQLGFPVGLVYNRSRLPASFATWTMPTPTGPTDWTNSPTITVWHNQGWFQAIYAVTGIDASTSTLTMSADGIWPSGGWQGGRTMENVDPNNLTVAQPMGSGNWYVSNVKQELDAPGEYFFDPATRKLYLFYNDTSGTPPPASYALVVSQLEVFFNLTGTVDAPVVDVTFAGLGFRDQRTAQLDPWVDPSGGDWGLRRAGLIHLEGTERATVSGCTFYRTDANAIFVAAYNRNCTIVDNEFAFTGFSAVATFGRTHQDDGTGGEQPWGTVIAYNKCHELGTYQLQSSCWFTSKSALTRAEGNVQFNGPRAMINVNDGHGGGNNMTQNAIFNTCRQSGDHGPINTWDRMPFLTKIRSGGGEASYSPASTTTSHNFIIANYGASQGMDNDDGSSWYDVHDNFYYDASGFKMDYGGHDSSFRSNVVIARSGQNCIGTASFRPGHADTYYDNDCVVYGKERVDDLFENCDSPPYDPPQANLIGYNNRYYTPNANASATCDCCGLRPLSQLPAGLATNFTSSPIPSGDVMIGWGRAKLGIPIDSARP